jgi:hypothetical protein
MFQCSYGWLFAAPAGSTKPHLHRQDESPFYGLKG